MSWPLLAAIATVLALLVVVNYPGLAALAVVVGAAGPSWLSRRITRRE
jgi:hypothetical protein